MLEFWPSFCQSLAIIFISEIADKTFILEMIYFQKLGAVPLLITSTLAMGLMDALAISIGYLLPIILLREIVDWIGLIVFLAFGIYSIYEYSTMENKTLAQKIEEENKENEHAYNQINDNETGGNQDNKIEEKKNDPSLIAKCCELFLCLCMCELGDKSQIVTISIAALYNVLGVIAGTMLAYTTTCCLAIFLGTALGVCITEKQMTLIGGFCFLFFALEIILNKLGFTIF